MNTHNIYFHGEISKMPKLIIIIKKKSSGTVFIVCSQSLTTLTLMLWADSSNDKLAIFFPRKKDLTRHANYLLPKETICMKSKILNLISYQKKKKKKKKIFKMSSAEIFTQHAKVLKNRKHFLGDLQNLVPL